MGQDQNTRGAWLSFRAGQREWLLPEREIVRFLSCHDEPLHPLPFPAPDVEGLIHVDGRAVPVFSLPAQMRGDEPDAADMYIVVSAERDCFAFRAGDPIRVLTPDEAKDRDERQRTSVAALMPRLARS